MSSTSLNKRKSDHIELAFRSQLSENDSRFYYEPLLAPSPDLELIPAIQIAGKNHESSLVDIKHDGRCR